MVVEISVESVVPGFLKRYSEKKYLYLTRQQRQCFAFHVSWIPRKSIMSLKKRQISVTVLSGTALLSTKYFFAHG